MGRNTHRVSKEMDTTGIPLVDEMKAAPGWSIPDDASCDLSVGVVVPVFNEAESLDYYLSRLYEVTRARCPVVIVDGGSTDSSVSIGQRFFHTESTGRPNRSEQLNHGARCLVTDVVLFLHAGIRCCTLIPGSRGSGGAFSILATRDFSFAERCFLAWADFPASRFWRTWIF